MKELDVDLKILSFHWGDEYITIPSPYQIELGHYAIDNGADIIVGHHPHVVQPIESYKNGLIMYSLGNCIFDFLQSKKFRNGMIVKVFIDEFTRKINYELFPIKLNYKNFFNVTYNKRTKYIKALDKKLLETIINENYRKKYIKKLKIYHLFERIFMKFHLIKLLLILNKKEKIVLINNIKNYLIK